MFAKKRQLFWNALYLASAIVYTALAVFRLFHYDWGMSARFECGLGAVMTVAGILSVVNAWREKRRPTDR